MKTHIPLAITLAISLGNASAVTSFTGADNSDFADLLNWDNGVPGSGNDGTIDGGRIADLASTVAGGTSTLRVGRNGSAGTLNINGGGLYNTANGGASDVRVGVGAGSVGTINVNSGGNLSVLGAGADLFLGDAAGGQGFITINDGGNLDARKALEIINGKLSFAPTATYNSGRPQDELVVDNAGILGFQTDGTTVLTVASTLNALELGSTSTLHMELGGLYQVGDTWTLITGISAFSGVNGGDGTGVFGTVVDPNNAGNQFTVSYGTQLDPTALVVELVSVPEPSSAALLGFGGLALILRRRK